MTSPWLPSSALKKPRWYAPKVLSSLSGATKRSSANAKRNCDVSRPSKALARSPTIDPPDTATTNLPRSAMLCADRDSR
eukprot:scaffold262_cov230-Pinguiococcus_pyrenoidosus.AAC.7